MAELLSLCLTDYPSRVVTTSENKKARARPN